MTTLAEETTRRDRRGVFLVAVGGAIGLYIPQASIFVFVVATILVGAAQQSLP
jgi:hypothetical protein